jgi:hypothetical protein
MDAIATGGGWKSRRRLSTQDKEKKQKDGCKEAGMRE